MAIACAELPPLSVRRKSHVAACGSQAVGPKRRFRPPTAGEPPAATAFPSRSHFCGGLLSGVAAAARFFPPKLRWGYPPPPEFAGFFFGAAVVGLGLAGIGFAGGVTERTAPRLRLSGTAVCRALLTIGISRF